MTRAARFEGRVGRTVAESEPWFDDPPHPGDDAPNVVIVLLDDTGFAQFGCYGSDIQTPNVDALAAGGYSSSANVTISVNEATILGWSATAEHSESLVQCNLFVGDASPVGAATLEGSLECG